MERDVNQALARDFGLNAEEYAKVLEILGHTPTLTELGVFSVMWSEHCSYKSSRVYLKQLPTSAPWVIHGPGENAGVVDIGAGLAAVFKMESHNHPSFIEPYQGAATGVGGILRDVFTMGARPIANLNALRFGDPAKAITKRIVNGVVRGIGGYGNCIGVPTVGGEVNFHRAYDGNPLVNAMTVGIARKDRIFLSTAAGVGNPVVYVGAKTGRDGIHGATMASAEFGTDAEEKRPTVQVGDPFTEKKLLEACLELMETDAIIAIQDMGAAGLTSSSVEMAGKGGVGITLDLDQVPQRESGMTAYEMMLSESQERMLMVLRPERTDAAAAIFAKWELDFAVIGQLTDTGRIVVRHQGRTEAEIPLGPLAREAPLYHRPTAEQTKPVAVNAARIEDRVGLARALQTLIACPDLASRAWIWDQYRLDDWRADGETPGGGRCSRGAGRWPGHGACTDNRLHAALLRRGPGDGRAPGGGGGVAEHHRGGRAAAGDHRQHEFRQSGEAGGDGPVRRGDPRDGDSLRGAEIPGREWQCQPVQRDRGARDPADAGDRRSGGDRRCGDGRRDCVAALAGPGADRCVAGMARPVAVAARDRRPRGGRASAGGSGRGKGGG